MRSLMNSKLAPQHEWLRDTTVGNNIRKTTVREKGGEKLWSSFNPTNHGPDNDSSDNRISLRRRFMEILESYKSWSSFNPVNHGSDFLGLYFLLCSRLNTRLLEI